MGDNNMRRGLSCTGESASPNCRALMRKLKIVEFALVDTVLYLDAYPDSKKAMAQYRRLVEERERISAIVNEKCGPTTALNVVDTDRWTWTDGPWPWQYEAN